MAMVAPRSLALLAIVCLGPAVVPGGADIVPGRNVNMVSGTEWPGGDPFLQRQNESSMAVSTRNALHLLAGANDYRTVDLPGLPDDRVVGDAWLGVFKSFDGGSTWRSTLLPGYPQDDSPQGLASPLKGFQAGADPTVRAGTNGLFYYSGIVLDREENGKGAVFVARFMDLNNKENGDPIAYLDTRVIDLGNAGQFIDKPWLFVDLPRPGAATCSVAGQTFAAGNVYLTYSVFVGSENNLRTKILFARSTDCGATWSRPVKISEGYPLNQGTTLAVDPVSGAVYVFWRQFQTHQVGDAIIMARSTDGGQTFTKPVQIQAISPFDQGTTIISFRTNAYPAAAVDEAGRVYLAWAQRGAGPGGDTRIVLSVSTDGGAGWSPPTPVDAAHSCAGPNPGCRGHQIMPSLAFAGGRLILVYYDLRLDHTVGRLIPLAPPPPAFEETREPAGNLPADPEVVYTSQIMDAAPAGSMTPLLRRHTIDVFAVQATPGAAPLWEAPVRVSQYAFGNPRLTDGGAPGETPIRQLQFNPPNLPLFRLGTAAFFSDYVDVAVSSFRVVPGTRQWVHTDGSEAPVHHATWTDNRDVRPPPDGNWANYVPVGSTGGASLFDPGQQRPACQPEADGRRTGMRNQNVYTARLTQGLLVGSPGNSKPLGQTQFPDGTVGLYQRAFVVFAGNASDDLKHYRLTIADQPVGGQASFLQFGSLTELEATIAPRSSITRTVFVTSTDPDATVTVLVREIDAIGGGLVPPDQGGLQGTVTLNGDPTNPDVTNPDVTNPDVTNPDVTNAEVYNPDVTNPDVTNPDVTNPDVTNPDVTNPDVTNVNVYNPDVTNPDVTNPDVTNPDVTNPDVTNPDVTNSDIQNGSVTDATWTATNNGNTAAGYSLKLLLNGSPPPNGFKLQLILHKPYATPVALGCELKVQTQNVLIASIPRPEFADPGDIGTPDPTNPDVTNATLFLAPGESARITLRVVDPVANDAITWDPTTRVTPAVEAQAVNTEDALDGSRTPPVALPITITTDSLPAGPSYTPYLRGLTATGGEGAYTWSIREGGLPPGLTLDPATGVIAGTPVSTGTFAFTASVLDSAVPAHGDTQPLSITITPSLVITTTSPLPDAVAGSPYGHELAASGGSGTYAWSLAPDSPALPRGLTFSGTGLLSGSPGALGEHTFTVRVSDSSAPAEVAERTLSLSVSLPAPLSGFGTATVDGVLAPGEWDGAGRVELVVSVPGGASTPATLFAMNDAANLYLALRFARDVADPGNSLAFDFDNDDDGFADDGDDRIAFDPASGFSDEFRSSAGPGPCAPEVLCAFLDVDDDGSNDGEGAFVNRGGSSVYEVSHPLDSEDRQHDFRLAGGDAVGFFLSLQVTGSNEEVAETAYPGPGLFARIVLARSGLLVDPAGDATADDRIETPPDLVQARATVVHGALTLSVLLAKGTFDPGTTLVQFLLDTDQDPSTGHPGSDASGESDAGVIGVEYLVEMGSALGGAVAHVSRYAGTPNEFTEVGTVPVTFFADGAEATVPLSLLEDDGALAMKAVCSAQVSDAGYTGVLDYMTDVGSPPGIVR